jgi:hypothetical protein
MVVWVDILARPGDEDTALRSPEQLDKVQLEIEIIGREALVSQLLLRRRRRFLLRELNGHRLLLA